MASAEYYNPGGASQAPLPGPQFHPPQPHPPQMSQTPPYPMSDAPPPYTAYAEQRPHSQPPPQQRPVGPGGPVQYGPQNGPNYPPEKGSRLQNMYRPSDFLQTPQFQQHPQPASQLQQSGYFQGQQGTPAMAQVYGDGRRPSSTPAYPQADHYRRDSHARSRSRDRSRSRSKHRQHHHQRPGAASRKKSSGVSTFLGAGGGAIIGDAIFPGLGTIGGAILGGVGGHEYGKQKRSYSSDYRQRPRSYSNDAEYYEEHRRGRKYD